MPQLTEQLKNVLGAARQSEALQKEKEALETKLSMLQAAMEKMDETLRALRSEGGDLEREREKVPADPMRHPASRIPSAY